MKFKDRKILMRPRRRGGEQAHRSMSIIHIRRQLEAKECVGRAICEENAVTIYVACEGIDDFHHDGLPVPIHSEGDDDNAVAQFEAGLARLKCAAQ
jgi:hypothetical protein